MSGLLNVTGSVSGILGTTVGTPSGGTVLQVMHDETSGWNSFGSTGSYAAVSGFDVAFDCKSATSKVLFQCVCAGAGKASGNTQLGFRLAGPGGLSVVLSEGHHYTGSTVMSMSQGFWMYIHDHNQSVGTTLTYIPQFNSANSIYQAFIGQYVATLGDVKHICTITEFEPQ